MAVPYEKPAAKTTTPAPRTEHSASRKAKNPAQPDIVTEHSAGQGAPAGTVAPVDWSSLLGQAGLPPNVINEVSGIFAKTSDLTQAVALSQAYIRSTPWYAQTYPGIQSGINAGLYSDERGYRAYHNQLSQLTQQYLGRPATALETAQHSVAGTPLDTIEKQYSGQAYIAANQGDIQQAAGAFGDTGALTKPELKALGNEQAGLDTPLGQAATLAYQKALTRLHGAFKGVLASPSLSLVNGVPVGRVAGRPPDVAA